MSDLNLYFQAQEKTRTARAQIEMAYAKCENALIHERLAELRSQHEPLASLEIKEMKSERDRLYAAAFYVVIGRWPE